MNIAIVLNGKINFNLEIFNKKLHIDYWIAVDGGYDVLSKNNIVADTVIGDFDSSLLKPPANSIVYSPEKDYSDGYIALNFALNNFKNIDNIFVIGIIDDCRLEHFFANILNFKNNLVRLITRNNLIFYTDKSLSLPYLERCDYISFYNLSEISNLTISNAKYNVTNVSYDANQFIGLSNEFNEKKEPIDIAFESGELIGFYSFKEI